MAVVYFILPKNKIKNSEEIIETVSNMADELGYENALSELSISSTEQVGNNVYYRLQQNHNGIPVYGRSVVYVTGKNGKTISVTGNVQDINTVLTPTVTQEKVEEEIEDYVRKELGHTWAENVNVSEIKEESLCIYDLGIDKKQDLAYEVQVSVTENDFLSSYDMIVDATEGDILLCCSNIYTEMVPLELDGKSESDMVVDLNRQRDKERELYYTMRDEKRHIRIYSANNATLQYELYDFSDNLVRDRNGVIIRGDTKITDVYLTLLSENGITEPVSEEDPPKFDKKAVALLSNLQTTYDFYEDILEIENIGTSDTPTRINGVYNDYKGGDDTNAYCWTARQMKDVLLSFGTRNSLELDVVAHEYTHAIEWHRSDMLYQSESGAIKEALGDIFGELVESEKTEQAPDWEHNNSRNISNPEKDSLPSVYKGKNWQDTSNPIKTNDWGGVHNNSTVISHVAYLIWDRMDGDNSEKISNLAKLWYSAMLMMPSDCDFEQCRIFVELAAQNLNFTEEQMRIIQGAFDEAGIYTQEFAYEISEQSTLLLVGKDGQLYDNYNLYIMPIKIEPNAKALISDSIDIHYVVNNSENVQSVSKAEPYELRLKEGVYAIAMVDNENTTNAIVHTFRVHDDGAKSFTIGTDFGTKNANPNAASAYIPVVQQVIEENLLPIPGWGFLEDFDHDGEEELLMSFSCELTGSTVEAGFVYSIYDYENGKLVPVVEKEVLSNIDQYGYASVVFLEGNPMLMTASYNSNEHDSTSWNHFKFYKEFGEIMTDEYVVFVNSNYPKEYYINGSNFSMKEFSQQILKYDTLEINEWGHLDNKLNNNAMSLAELIDYLKILAQKGEKSDKHGVYGNHIKWDFYADTGTLVISGKGEMEDRAIAPWEEFQDSIENVYIDYGITKVGAHSFSNHKNLRNVIMEPGVKIIGKGAFWLCHNLEKIKIPDSVSYIGEYALGGHNKLTEVTIPEGVTFIGDSVFSSDSNLISVLIPDTVTSIGRGAFAGCRNLVKADIPDSVEVINDFAFDGCWNLEDLSIPDKVVFIGDNAFVDCGMSNIEIPDTVVYLGDHAFQDCEKLTDVRLPDTISRIGSYTFYGCTRLREIIVPESVGGIGDRAFEDCKSLKDIYFLNADCTIYDSLNAPCIRENAVIHGYADSTAQEFAQTFGYQFVEMKIQEEESLFGKLEESEFEQKTAESYQEVLINCKNQMGYDNMSDSYKKECYGLIEDLNNDGTEELTLTYCKNDERRCEIWTLKDDQVICIFETLAGYYSSKSQGGYLDLMEFQGKCYLTFFGRTLKELPSQGEDYYLGQEDWIFYELEENGYSQKHTLQIQYSYDNVYEVPRAESYIYDGKEIPENKFFEICPEKIADIINLGGDCMEEDLINSVSSVGYVLRFTEREVDFDTLLKQLETKTEAAGNGIHGVYGNFLVNKSYEKYVGYYWGKPESYAILDFEKDGTDELLIKSEYNVLYDSYEYLVFGYKESSGEIVFLGDKVENDLQAEYQLLP